MLLDTAGPGQGFHWPGVGAARTHLDQAGGGVPPLLEVLLPVLFLHFQGKARPQDALQVTGVRRCPGPTALACTLQAPGSTSPTRSLIAWRPGWG